MTEHYKIIFLKVHHQPPLLLEEWLLYSYQYDDVVKWKLFSALLAICAGNSLVTGEFPTKRPMTRSFGVFFDLCLNKRLSKKSWGWWFETLSRPLWRHCNEAWMSFIHAERADYRRLQIDCIWFNGWTNDISRMRPKLNELHIILQLSINRSVRVRS